MNYGITKTIELSYEEAIEKVTEELKKEGFGVLTTIDVKETLKKKLDVDFQKYIILGACNPPFAYEALKAEEQIGLLMPCNVIIYEKEGKTVVSAFNPATIAAVSNNEKLNELSAKLNEKIYKVIDNI
ncbi:MAG: DUF302 domain-containing protein [Ignavibacteriae bacterium]|nr:DUF302 domain-containing protein [Ignavibacteriota bacterium]